MSRACIVIHAHAEYPTQTWCGKRLLLDFVFQSIEHAAYNAMNRGRLEPCADCLAAVVGALQEGTLPDVPLPAPSAPAVQAYFMGVWHTDRVGHYCRDHHGRKYPAETSPWAAFQSALGEGGGLLPEDGAQVEGIPFFSWRDGWTCVALWDRSADRRGNSSAAFCVNEHIQDRTQAIARMRGLFPGVWARIERHLGRAVTP